uniref:Uncharacterized protein n=1 Tax=Arundo donax TaxID=35708 RepID=A0A0A9DKT1_ARUDO
MLPGEISLTKNVPRAAVSATNILSCCWHIFYPFSFCIRGIGVGWQQGQDWCHYKWLIQDRYQAMQVNVQ